MVQVTVENITDVAPEFASVDEAIIEFAIESARDFVHEGRWGEQKAKRGIMLMAMHLLAVQGLGDGGVAVDRGPVASETVGSISTSYVNTRATVTDDKTWMIQSKYGAQFLMLRKTLIRTPGFFTKVSFTGTPAET